MSDEITLNQTGTEAVLRTGYDADIQALRDELTQMREEFTQTIEEYRQANSDLWARLQSQTPTEPYSEPSGPTSEEIFNSIMR